MRSGIEAPTAALPAGWEERIDPESGRAFFINHNSKTTSWERPRGGGGSPYSASRVHPPQSTSRSSYVCSGGSGSTGGESGATKIDSDAELAAELAAQFAAEEDAEAGSEAASALDRSSSLASRSGSALMATRSKAKAGMAKGMDGWADDASATHCFLTNTPFSLVVQRKHHCRYCGQIFIGDVCKKMIKIPSAGFLEAVRVCDVCHDQIERGDPVCFSRQIAVLRGSVDSAKADAIKELANWAAMDPQFAALAAAAEQLHLAELISGLLAPSNSDLQLGAASLLAALLQYPEFAELVESADLLSPLLSALRGSKPELKKKAAVAILALTASIEGRVQLREAGGLNDLLDVLLSSTPNTAQGAELWESITAVLANLCDDDGDDWWHVSQAGVVFSLAAQMGTSHGGLQEALLTLLAILCSHVECRDQVIDANAMPPLTRLLGSSKTNVQRCALALTQQLCGSRKGCDSLLEVGAAVPLAALLSAPSSTDVEVAVAVLECLEALSRSGMAQAQSAVRNAGAVPHLIQLMSHQHARIAHLASSLVADLCPGDVHNAEQLYESGGLVMLAEQLNSHDVRAQVQALSALSQLSANPQQAGAIVENGCVTPILELLDHPSPELKSYAAITFANFCSSGAIPQSQLEHPSVLPHLVHILSSSNSIAKGPAAGALASMANQPHLRMKIYELGGLPGLLDLLSSSSDTSYHAVQAVAQFAADERYRATLGELDGLGALPPLLASQLPHVAQCALSAIANVSFVPAAVAQLASAGATAHLGQMLFGASATDSAMVLTALTNILIDTPSASDSLLQVGGHMALVTALSSPAADTQSQAAMAIGHMCHHPSALQAMLMADTVPQLAQMLHSSHPSVRLQAVYALGVLAAEDDGAASAITLAGAVAPLTTLLLSSSSVEIKKHLTLTLAHAVRGDWRAVFNVGGFQALLEVLAVGAAAVQQDVSSSIGELLEDTHQRRALLADMNSLSSVVSLLSSSNMVTQQNAAKALAALAQEEAAREVLYRLGTLSHVIRSISAANARREGAGGGTDAAEDASRVSMLRVVAAFAADPRYTNMLRITIQPLVALLASSDADAVHHAALAITSLSRSEPNRDALRDAGALCRMFELLLHVDSTVQEAAVQCIANLGVEATAAVTFLRAGWHLPLISLLSSDCYETNAAAAAVLGNLACSSDFRAALIADGALQPILQLLHAPSLPARTAAVRALAIMTQQLMSAIVPKDDPAASDLVDALFDTAAVPKLLQVLTDSATDAPTHGATAAESGDLQDAHATTVRTTAATAERQLIAVLLLLQNLAGGHGHVRPRLIEAGTVEALVGFLKTRALVTSRDGGGRAGGRTAQSKGAAIPAGEMLDAAGSALADLMLAPSGAERLDAMGGPVALLPLLLSPRVEVQSALARTIGHMAHHCGPLAQLAKCVPTLCTMLAKGCGEAVLDTTFAVANLYTLRYAHHALREAFTASSLSDTAAGALRGLDSPVEALRQISTALLHTLLTDPAGRHALHAAGAELILNTRRAKMLSEGDGTASLLQLLLGMLSVPVAESPSTTSAVQKAELVAQQEELVAAPVVLADQLAHSVVASSAITVSAAPTRSRMLPAQQLSPQPPTLFPQQPLQQQPLQQQPLQQQPLQQQPLLQQPLQQQPLLQQPLQQQPLQQQPLLQQPLQQQPLLQQPLLQQPLLQRPPPPPPSQQFQHQPPRPPQPHPTQMATPSLTQLLPPPAVPSPALSQLEAILSPPPTLCSVSVPPPPSACCLPTREMSSHATPPPPPPLSPLLSPLQSDGIMMAPLQPQVVEVPPLIDLQSVAGTMQAASLL